jgi:hypothetical protein
VWLSIAKLVPAQQSMAAASHTKQQPAHRSQACTSCYLQIFTHSSHSSTSQMLYNLAVGSCVEELCQLLSGVCIFAVYKRHESLFSLLLSHLQLRVV